ncbi:MAG TPA: hypothetical protein VMA37_04700 [Acetobacteraceae bacterium]|nr:hypothetical protein [Acetobacteraceae bacterium]
MRVRVPEGVTAVSARQQEFTPDRFGIITVPDDLGVYLLGLRAGFAVAGERSPSAGAAMLSAAGKPTAAGLGPSPPGREGEAGKARKAGDAERFRPPASGQGKA